MNAAATPPEPMACYAPRHDAASRFVDARGLSHHLCTWHLDGADAPLRVLLHGFMDCGASYQFVVDAMPRNAPTVAPDLRGFGRTRVPDATDAFWFADYLGDLDALLDVLSPDAPVDLVGHSMGGNVAMAYAGLRPARVRRLVNLEGFALPDVGADAALGRQRQWLDELKHDKAPKPHASLDAFAHRMRQQNPRLEADKARWLAAHWAVERPDGRWSLRAHPAHRRVHGVPFRLDETMSQWRAIDAPTLVLQARGSTPAQWWGERYPQAEFERRLREVRRAEHRWVEDAGHMLHHDQPAAVARAIDAFLAG